MLHEFKVKSEAAWPIIGEFNERIPEDTEIISFFVNNIPMANKFKSKIKLQILNECVNLFNKARYVQIWLKKLFIMKNQHYLLLNMKN